MAVIAGYIVILAFVLGATYALQAVEPGWFLVGVPLARGYLATNLAYSVVAAFAGGIATVRIASRAPLKHAWALAAVNAAMTLVSLTASDSELPGWFQSLRTAMMMSVIVSAGRPWSRSKGQQDVAGDTAAGRIS